MDSALADVELFCVTTIVVQLIAEACVDLYAVAELCVDTTLVAGRLSLVPAVDQGVLHVATRGHPHVRGAVAEARAGQPKVLTKLSLFCKSLTLFSFFSLHFVKYERLFYAFNFIVALADSLTHWWRCCGKYYHLQDSVFYFYFFVF